MNRPAVRGPDGCLRASLPGVNPLQKARDGAGTAWQGTKRTAGWVTGGIGGTIGDARSKMRRSQPAKSKEPKEPKEPGAIRDGVAGVWDRVGGAWLVQRGRADNRVGAALIVGAILFVLWIAWTVYVWSENGTAAGLGVLISWPAVLLALALVAAPFVGAVVLVRRLAANDGPTLAVAGGGTTEATAAQSEESEQESEDADQPDDQAEDEVEEEADDSGDEADEDEDEPSDEAEGEEK
jgi:hypothetical protein